MTEENDEVLLKAYFKDKNQLAFKLIFDRHAGVLFSFTYRFTKNHQAADEIVQDTFTELLSGKFTDTFPGSLKAWLFTVSRNKSLNFLKKRSLEVTTEPDLDEQRDSVDLEENVIHLDLLARLKRTEMTLPTDLLQTWNLRKQGLDNNQIAAELSIPVGTVKSRSFRLVEKIKEEFLR